MNAPERVAVAERAARAGAAVAHDWFRTDLDIETKRDKTDPVTEADRRTQKRVVSEIRRVYPDDTVVEEETGTVSTLPAGGVAWIVDPIDGTTNYVRENPQWATAVAVVRDRDPVAAVHVMPALGDVYVAGPDGLEANSDVATVSDRTDPERFAVSPMMGWGLGGRDGVEAVCGELVERFGHVRRYGTGQVTLSMVATGQLEGGFTFVQGRSWDRISGAYMVRQAGGTVTDLSGDPWTLDASGMVASNGTAHDEFLTAVEAVRDRHVSGPEDDPHV